MWMRQVAVDGRIMLFPLLWCNAYENRCVTHAAFLYLKIFTLTVFFNSLKICKHFRCTGLLRSIKLLHLYGKNMALHKKWSFPLKISSVNVTKSAIFCGFGQIYWGNPNGKLHFLCVDLCVYVECFSKIEKKSSRITDPLINLAWLCFHSNFCHSMLFKLKLRLKVLPNSLSIYSFSGM